MTCSKHSYEHNTHSANLFQFIVLCGIIVFAAQFTARGVCKVRFVKEGVLHPRWFCPHTESSVEVRVHVVTTSRTKRYGRLTVLFGRRFHLEIDPYPRNLEKLGNMCVAVFIRHKTMRPSLGVIVVTEHEILLDIKHKAYWFWRYPLCRRHGPSVERNVKEIIDTFILYMDNHLC